MSKMIHPVSWQTEMGAKTRPLCPLCSLCPGTRVPGEDLFVYILSVSWTGSRERHVSGVWLHMHRLSFYTKIFRAKFLAFISAVDAWPLPEAGDLNHCDRNLYCLWVACRSMICSSKQTRRSCYACFNFSHLHSGHRCCTLAIALHLPSA